MMPTVRMPMLLAMPAMTGAAPVPVPPPMPAVTNAILVPSSSSRLMSSWVFCASLRPTSGFAPAPKPLYLLFLNHPEGIEFKNLVDYREELLQLYQKIENRIDMDKITETVNRLVNPLDNAINEKCSRIKAAFSDMMDEYQADYYIINSHVKRHQGSSMKLWFERLKIINLPRELVVYQCS